MADDGIDRRLAAVSAAGIAGQSRPMNEYECQTVLECDCLSVEEMSYVSHFDAISFGRVKCFLCKA